MRKLLVKTGLFLIPFIVYGIMIVIIDPFNLFNISHLFGNEAKRITAVRINGALWKIIEYRRNPKENILLGDSKMNGLNTETIKKVSGADYYNFAYSGGNVDEIIDTVWLASKLIKLKRVYIGLSLDSYNTIYGRFNRVKEAWEIINDPFLYFSNKTVASATYNTVAYKVTGQTTLGQPTMSRDTFWQYQLNVSAVVYYQKYTYPEKYFLKLKEISNYCKNNQIKLVLIIFPTHVDLQKKINEYHLTSQNLRFREDLAQIAITYDFNYENRITRARNNFNDPFHYNHEIGELIIHEVWGKPTGFAKIYNSDSIGN